MRNVHFSRNPKIAAFLKDYEYVKEFGEGIDRMYREMAELGLPEPEYSTVAFMTNVVVKNNIDAKNTGTENRLEKDLEKDLEKNCSLNHNQVKILNEISRNNKITQKELAAIVGINEKNIRNNIKELKDKNLLKRIGPDKGGHWEIINHNFVQQ